MLPILIFLLSALHLATAHFTVAYPPWRASSFIPPANQYIYPCAGISTNSSTNRTEWPLTGGSLLLKVGHTWAFTYINLGLGANVSTFNIPLAAFNQTGNGTFCVPRMALPTQVEVGGAMVNTNITEGGMGTLQVVQIGHSGSALYNCADISFSSAAQALGTDICFNSTGVGGTEFGTVAASNTTAGSGAAANATGASTASLLELSSFAVLGSAIGLTVLLAL